MLRLEAAGGASVARERSGRAADRLAERLRVGGVETRLALLRDQRLGRRQRGMRAQLRTQAGALMRRVGVEHGQGFEQVHRRCAGAELAHAFEGRGPAAGGERALRVLAGDEVEGGRVRHHQHAPQRQHLGMLAAPRRALAGQHQRARGLRRRLAGVAQRAGSFVVLLPGVGLERDLAPVMRDARRKGAGAAVLELLRNFDGSPPVARTLVQREQRQARFGVEGRSLERAVGRLGAVEQAGFHEVLRERVLRAVTLAAWQVGPVQQVLMNADRALELAAAAEQGAEGEVQLGGVGVVLHGLDKCVDGLVGLFVEQQVQALEDGLRLRALFFAPLPHVDARADPAEREGQRQADQQPLDVEVEHQCCGGSAASAPNCDEGWSADNGGCRGACAATVVATAAFDVSSTTAVW